MKLKPIFLLVFSLVFIFLASATNIQSVQSTDEKPQALDPTSWQTTAQGMESSIYGNVGALGMTINVNGWPSFSLHGGVATVGFESITGPVGIQLGQAVVPGGNTPGAPTQVVDWAKNEMTFDYGSGSLKLWATRTSPAVLLQTPTNQLRLFTGDVNRYSCVSDDCNPTSGPAYPKYVAYSTSAGIQRAALSSSVDLSGINQNWLLVWYGSDSHFFETKKPTSYSGPDYDHASLPYTEAYLADAPILILLQKQPTTIQRGSGGGVDITLSQANSYVGILPLLGRDHPRASNTEAWVNGLPADVVTKIQWWAGHLCSYPTTVQESYGYNAANDTASIIENITFLDNVLCSSGTRFAPIPPMVGIVKDVLGISFSSTVVNANLPTEFGPTLGIENTSQYTWSVSGLGKITDNQRLVANNTAPTDLLQELDAQVQRMVSAGHMAPWIFLDDYPVNPTRGALYWANPADSLYQLIEIADALPAGATKTSLTNYIRSERNTYPPETTYDLPIRPDSLGGSGGTERPGYAYYGLTWDRLEWYWSNSTSQYDRRGDEHLQDVPLYNFYSLGRYYVFTGDDVPDSVMTNAQTVLDRDMREQDWASSYWFYGYQDRRIAVVNASRHFAGMLGYVRLAHMSEDASEGLARALLAKAAVTRLGMLEYPRYLYSAGLVELPSRPDWQPFYSRERWRGHLFNTSWTGASDDARQVFTWDQHEVYLYDHSGNQRWGYEEYEFVRLTSPSMIGYRDMVPELGKLFADTAKNDALIYANKFAALAPHWYAAFGEAIFGMEHNLNHPVDSFQVFMAKAWIGGESANLLAGYVDLPWLQTGDLFYTQKLAEAIKVYRGVSWGNSLQLSGTGSDKTIQLLWYVSASLPSGSSYTIEYTGPAGSQPSPITGIPTSTTSYTLTGLTNYTIYTVKVKAVGEGGEDLLTSNTVSVMPTDIFIFLPVIRR